MTDERENLPVGHDPPSKPKHSLPSYREPTPETHRKVSREEEAELALKNTLFSPGSRGLIITIFLATIVAVPAIQFTTEFEAVHSFRRLPTFATFASLASRFNLRQKRSPTALWQMLPRAEETKSVERTLESESVVGQWLLPRAQSVLTQDFHVGNEQVYLGRDNWFFYRDDVDYVTGQGFLNPIWMKRRARVAEVQPNAVRAIVEFRNQLARRGIELVVVPVPVKPSMDGEMFATYSEQAALFENESFSEFKMRLENERVRVFDPEPLLMEYKRKTAGAPLYLKADTHWRPETMEFVAQQLATRLNFDSPPHSMPLQLAEKTVTAVGDVARMLKLPVDRARSHAQEITIHQITAGNSLWRPSGDAEVLLLGDSFSNIFSLDALGWGESAGFAEHLSRALGGRPLDCILRNSEGAFATREVLSHELARGRDRLAGKKLVIWEFATRELAFGNWKLFDMTLGHPAPARFCTPQPGEIIIVTGTIESVSSVPRPGRAPYADHIMAVHLVDVGGSSVTGNPSVQCLIYLWSMRENVWTPAARLHPGERITLRLRPWTDVSAELEKINRSEIEDPALQLEEPSWGELIK